MIWLAITAVCVLGIWDICRRYFETIDKHEQLSALQEQIEDLNETLAEIDMSALTEFAEKQRAVMKGFIDSMTDIIKISEEEKNHLRNQVAASRFDKKKV